MLQELKRKLRNKLMLKVSSLSEEQYAAKSVSIAARLYEQQEWKQARTIGITLSMNHEVDTYAIIETAWREGKIVAVPKCYPETRTMAFHRITTFEQLEVVYMNLQEPIVEATKEVAVTEMDVLIVPGLAFTRSGERLGYGGGYYDRYLSAYSGDIIALAFSEQIVSYLPTDSYDQKVPKIITEQTVIHCSGRI